MAMRKALVLTLSGAICMTELMMLANNYSFRKHLVSTYYVLGINLDTGSVAEQTKISSL